jgi:dTMP kinase
METAGRLIAVEGLDGSGKSTQVYLLKRWLELTGHKVYLTEWNSSSIVKEATSRGKKRQLLTPTSFSLIHCTDFADRYEQQILPLLSAGYVVLADRYIYTAFARDAVRGCDRGWLRELYSYARHPDVTLFFNTPLEVALGRILDGRPSLKYHEAGMDMGFSPDPYESFRIFQGKIYEEYLRMCAEYGFTTVDAVQSVNVQQRLVRRIVSERINLEQFTWTTR